MSLSERGREPAAGLRSGRDEPAAGLFTGMPAGQVTALSAGLETVIERLRAAGPERC